MARSLLCDALLFFAGATVATALLLTLASPFSPSPAAYTRHAAAVPRQPSSVGGRTFYDDPDLTYTMDRPIARWDEKRAEWLRTRPELSSEERVLMVSGSQPAPCRSPVGDHLLTRLLKNKADYCRLNGLQLLYNTALLRPSMGHYWAKIPLVRAAMVAHPDAEWVWWVDSDAVLTDMDFRLPLHRYANHNLVVHGWPALVYDSNKAPTWTGLNAGVFLIRNCQWSLDFMAAWAAMGPDSPDYQRWGAVLTSTFKDKVFNESDDQSALVYMLMQEGSPWRDKVFLEDGYYFEGYWLEIVPRLGNITERYEEMERRAPAGLRRPHAAVRDHAERVAARNAALEGAGLGQSGVHGWRRPFVTHFTGCQPCSGDRNRHYSGDSCNDGMRRALNFADDQVLRSYGFRHADPLSDDVRPLPFDYPAAAKQ
jgi:hypothetical protein